MDISQKLDEAFQYAEMHSYRELASNLPSDFIVSLKDWKFGSYGWTSPVNLLITAAWYKWLFPSQDVCKIWGADHNKQRISGGFAIRTNDEKYTVPLVTKTGISEKFCSPNSGMQGSRAIEKMRGQGRIERNTLIDQAVSFDMSLFQKIMNDINDCSSHQAFNFLCLLLRIGIDLRNQREEHLEILKSSKALSSSEISKLINFTKKVSDPQFVRVVIAYMLHPIVEKLIGTVSLNGMEGKKTAADTQSKVPGDFWYEALADQCIVAVEVKDSTKSIGFDILQAIENRKRINTKIENYIVVSAADIAITEQNLRDPYWNRNIARLREEIGVNITCLSINEVVGLFSLAGGNIVTLINSISDQLARTPDLKPNTIQIWSSHFLLSSSY